MIELRLSFPPTWQARPGTRVPSRLVRVRHPDSDLSRASWRVAAMGRPALPRHRAAAGHGRGPVRGAPIPLAGLSTSWGGRAVSRKSTPSPSLVSGW